MIITVQTEERTFRIDPGRFHDISIPLRFGGEQPNAYGVERAVSEPCRSGDLVGDTRLGGSCNFERYTLIPHCNGTHTECLGHLTRERITVPECLRETFIPALLVSVEPEPAGETSETRPPETGADERLITRRLLGEWIEEIRDGAALVVRTLPNGPFKQSARYDADNVPPFFSQEALDLVVEAGVRHLLCDLPSIDRIYDGGRLSNHRRFWNLPAEGHESGENARRECTVTELIHAGEEVPDGPYLLALQIAPFATDAAPSRPLLFRPL